MGGNPASIPVRTLGVAVALVTAYAAVSIRTSGEFRSKGGVVQLAMWGRILAVSVLGLLAVVAGWVAIRGRA